MTLNAYDDEQICSGGLSLLGLPAINSLSAPTSDIEAVCARIYPITISGLLSRYEWNFADGVVELAVDADAAPVGGYAYAYRLPSAMIAGPFAIYDGSDLSRPVHDYTNSGDYVHSSRASLSAKYRKKVPVSLWPDYFVELAYVALAARLAKPLIDNSAMATEYRIIAFGAADEGGEGGLFKSAKGVDAKTRVPRSLFVNGDPLTRQVR